MAATESTTLSPPSGPAGEMDLLPFLRALMHDLRGPLTSMRVQKWIQEKGDAEGKPPNDKAALVMEQGSDRLLRMLDDVSAWVHTVQGHRSPVPTTFRMDDLVTRTVAAHPADIVLCGGPTVTVQGDADWFQEVVVHLLDHGLSRASDETAVEVGWDEAAGQVCVWVSDDGAAIGTGVDPFYPLQRLPRTRNPDRPMGMALAQAMVAAHGGTCYTQEVGGRTRSGFRVPLKGSA